MSTLDSQDVSSLNVFGFSTSYFLKLRFLLLSSVAESKSKDGVLLTIDAIKASIRFRKAIANGWLKVQVQYITLKFPYIL